MLKPLSKRAILAVGALFLTAGALRAQDRTLEQVLQCHYENIGGLDAWQNLQTMEVSGTMTMTGPQGVMEVPITMYAKRPRKQRLELSMQGMTGIQAFDGETGWMLMPFMGQTSAEEMPAEMTQQMREESDIDGPLIGYEAEGIQLELMGQEEVEGTPAYRIKVTMPNGDEQTYFLETEYCLPIKVQATMEQAGQSYDVESIMGDYKAVDGLLMPHSIERRMGMQAGSQTMTLEEVTLNQPIPDSIFAMPKK